jgi:hypothetical protein
MLSNISIEENEETEPETGEFEEFEEIKDEYTLIPEAEPADLDPADGAESMDSKSEKKKNSP